MGLTRQEKRARQNTAWDDSASRSKYAAKKRKAGVILPGGALNVEAGSGSPGHGGSGLSVRARLAASQSGLIKLNTNKRDTRSIDEITRDLQEKRGGVDVKKVLTGAEAEKFGDWFSTKKDKERERQEREKQESERLAAVERERERERKAREREREREREKERERERERTKDRSRSGSVTAPSQTQSKRPAVVPAAPPKPAPIVIATKPSTLLSGGSKPSAAPKEYRVTVKTTGTPITNNPLPTPTSSAPTKPRVAAPAPTSKPASAAAKRPRSYDSGSDSYDSEEEERERARRRARKSAGGGRGGSGFDIWSIINPGKSRQEYLGRDVLSDDDEDMEATGRDLEREEKQRCARHVCLHQNNH